MAAAQSVSAWQARLNPSGAFQAAGPGSGKPRAVGDAESGLAFLSRFDRLHPATAYPGTYNLGLVATSVAIAILAAFVALSISGRIVAATTPLARYAWTSAGAISLGGGIWSMHCVGMLAFSLPCGITSELVRSSKRTEDDYGPARTCPAAPSFNSQCLPTQILGRDFSHCQAGPC